MKWNKRSDYIKVGPTDIGFAVDPSLLGAKLPNADPKLYTIVVEDQVIRGTSRDSMGRVVFDLRSCRARFRDRPYVGRLHLGRCEMGEVCFELLAPVGKHSGVAVDPFDLAAADEQPWAALQAPMLKYDKTMDLPEAFVELIFCEVQCSPTMLELIDCDRTEVVKARWENDALQVERTTYEDWPAGTVVRILKDVT